MSSKISKIFVPNSGNPASPLWLIGEAPGAEEEIQLQPFIGPSGQLLRNTLSRYGISPSDCFFANLCNFRPEGNKFENLIESNELAKGIDNLATLLSLHKPNVIGLLGHYPLAAFTSHISINSWRGSILRADNIAPENQKVIPTYHPAFILREPKSYPIFAADIQRIISERLTPSLQYTERTYHINPSGLDLQDLVERYCNEEWLSVDIESVRNSSTILCVGFARSSREAVCIPWTSAFNIQCIERLLICGAKKVFHNGTFDTEMLYLNGVNVTGYEYDTMVGAHILEPELPRSLGFLTSIYTREPYYKTEGRANIPGDVKSWSIKQDKDSLYIYNCKDVCCTFEIFEQQSSEVECNGFGGLFQYEMSLVSIASEISRNGLLIDQEYLGKFRNALMKKWSILQFAIDSMIGKHLNVNSSPQCQATLYDHFKLPVRYNKKKPTTDESAIISLITYCANKIPSYKTEKARDEWRTKQEVLRTIIEIRGIRKLLSSYVNITLSSDGRARSTFKVASTETGRWAADKYVDGTGLNAQTMPRTPIEIPDSILAEEIDIDKMLEELVEGDESEIEEDEELQST